MIKSLLTLAVIGSVTSPALKRDVLFESTTTEYTASEFTMNEQTFTLDDLLSNIDEFVDLPAGGTPWQIFGKTKETPYEYTDDDDREWSGVRPVFPDDLKKLDGSDILIQGYMFPLGQEEKQNLFLIGPFPLSCPYHYHVTPNLIIEVHAKTPINFTYNAVNIKGTLELVPKDDEYNVFFRLKDAVLAN